MGFGVSYLAEWMRQQPVDRRIAFARRRMGQILGSLLSARRVGMLEPDILEALGLSMHPLIRGALRGAAEA